MKELDKLQNYHIEKSCQAFERSLFESNKRKDACLFLLFAINIS
jgi:hypothetical protein